MHTMMQYSSHLLRCAGCVGFNKVARKWVFLLQPLLLSEDKSHRLWISTLLKRTKSQLGTKPCWGLIILNHFISLPFAMWHPCWTVGATELIFLRWNIEQATVARRQMPAVEYSTRLLVSSVFPGNIWVWPFLFIDWRLFLFPRAAKRRLRNATGGRDLTFSSEPGSQWREWEVWHVLAYYPSAHLSWQNKVMEGRRHHRRIAASIAR